MKTNILLAFLLSVMTIYFTYVMVMDDLANIEATKSGELVRAELISVRCGKSSFVKFRFDGKTYGKRIYASAADCSSLKNEHQIDLKVLDGDTIVFADEDYNDRLDLEVISCFLLGLFGLFCIYYYLIRKR